MLQFINHDHTAVGDFLNHFILKVVPKFLKLFLIIYLELRLDVLLYFVRINKIHVVFGHTHRIGLGAEEIVGDADNTV